MSPPRFPIVGIGASAGGIEALEGLFSGIPEQPGLAFIVVTHLGPGRESLLPQIVARFTPMPVLPVVHGDAVRPDHVYVLTTDALVGMSEGRFELHSPAAREPKPIDIFFSSLAVDLGESAVGIVLSGGDGDGTLGLKAIKERGGLTLAQIGDEFGPRHPDMPDSAISAGIVDLPLRATEMGPRLVELARSIGAAQEPEDASNAAQEAEIRKLLPEIYAILRSQVGHDFSGYKKRTFIRRVQRRVQINQLPGIAPYIEMLRQRPDEVRLLFRDLLINVTSFFRDPDSFGQLASTVIPKLFAGKGVEDSVRIWVPGCATGEEVYSLAMLTREYMQDVRPAPRVQIFATDIDERALAVARTARYPAAMLEGVSDERRQRFFTADGSSYVVAKDVRDLCVFSPHSIIRDPPFSRIDMVSCRNLLIYFGPEIQSQVIPTFHYALRPEGYLFLGSAENVTQFEELFAPVDKHHRIFRRRSVTTPHVPLPIKIGASRNGAGTDLPTRRSPLNGVSLRQAVDNQVLERHAPAHVVVNHDGEVMYFSARTGKYLEVPAGLPTRQLLTLARKDMRLELRSLLREALECGRPVHRDGLAIEMDAGRVQMLTLLVEPIGDRAGSEPLFLVAFIDQGPLLSREEAMGRALNRTSQQAERELRDTRDRLQSLIEEYETSLEELKSANEELVSVNEELQSTNEELEASKEELQSVNEELHTVNSELNGKVEALDQANTDLVNLFEATDVATVFLDERLVIRSFTPSVSDVLSIRPGDLGRPITDLASRVELSELSTDISRVFRTGEKIERRATNAHSGAHYLVRLAPYVDGEKRVVGVVVTFVDVTTLARAEERQRMLVDELHHRTRNLLGVVQAVAARTMTGEKSLFDFGARLASLSRAQSLISGSAGGDIDLAEMIRVELDAVHAPLERCRISGPKARLSSDLLQTMSLALHELTTNAVKYGALGKDEGRLEVSWTMEETEDGRCRLTLHWREAGMELREQPTRYGFGRELIERALAHNHGARTTLEFKPDGVECTIQVTFAKQTTPPEAVTAHG